MTIQPKPEPGSSPVFTSTNPNENFEQKTIHDLVNVLRGTCQFDTFDIIEGVLVNRDMRLREDIQQLQKQFEREKLQLQEKLQMEALSRIQAEEEVRKREELCEKGKRVQESYETLLKEVKINGLADRNMIKDLRKKNNELECEVKNLKEKGVDDGNKLDVIRRKNAELESEVSELRKMKEKLVEDGNKLDVIRRKNAELESEVSELRKMKEKLVEDGNKLDVIRRKNAELESEVSELRKMKEKLVEDGYELDLSRKVVGELKNKVLELTKLNEKLVEDNALDELRGKICVLEDAKNALEERVKNHLTTISELGEENSKLANEKREAVILYKLLCTKYRDLQGRVSKLEAKLRMNVDASDGGNSEGEPRADHMVADFEDNGGNNEEEPRMNVDVSDGENSEEEPRADPDTDFEDNGEEDDSVEAAPLPRIEDAPHSHGVAASTQPLNVGSNYAKGASSGEKCWKVYTRKPKKTVEMAGSSRANGRVEMVNGVEVINLDDEDDDDDDDDDRPISQGVHGKTANFGIVVKDECPSSSVVTQQKSKITNAVVDTVKRKCPFPDIETSSDDSSYDSSFRDNLPISSVVSQGKKTKM